MPGGGLLQATVAATELGFRVIGGGRSSPMIEEVMGAVP
jgi:hypothetical protein